MLVKEYQEGDNSMGDLALNLANWCIKDIPFSREGFHHQDINDAV